MITSLRDARNYEVSQATLGETKRHNLATEGQERQKLAETARHNQASEAVQLFVAQEGARHNIESERNQRDQIALGYHTLGETQRHNYAMEQEMNRHNLSVEDETKRANQVNESISRFNADSLAAYRDKSIGLGYSQLSETKRANQANETLRNQTLSWTVHKESSQLAENHRSNLANEQLIRERNAETQRANQAYEALRNTQNQIEQDRLAELTRHNKQSERLEDKSLNISLGRAVTGGINDLASAGRSGTQAANSAYNLYDRATRVVIEGTQTVPVGGASFFTRGGKFGGGVSRGEVTEKAKK